MPVAIPAIMPTSIFMYNGMLAMFPFGLIFILLPIKLIGIYFIEKQIYTNNAFFSKTIYERDISFSCNASGNVYAYA
jgi:hypothetical protein